MTGRCDRVDGLGWDALLFVFPYIKKDNEFFVYLFIYLVNIRYFFTVFSLIIC